MPTAKELITFIQNVEPLMNLFWHGNLDREFNCITSLENSRKNGLSFSTEPLIQKYFGVILCPSDPLNLEPIYNDATLVMVHNPRLWFIRAVKHFFPKDDSDHYYLSINDLRQTDPSSIINNHVIFGKNVIVKPLAVIGFNGFGYEKNEKGEYEHFPHSGGVVIGNNVSIGSNTCIDRGTLGDTIIGDGTKIDNLVHIAHNVKIGKNCLIVALSCIGGSVEIGDDVTIWMGASIRDHVKIGKGAVVGMGSVVTKDVEPYTTVIGVPAKPIEEKK